MFVRLLPLTSALVLIVVGTSSGCGDDDAAAGRDGAVETSTPDAPDPSDASDTAEPDGADASDTSDPSDTSDTAAPDVADTSDPSDTSDTAAPDGADTTLGDDVYGPRTPPPGDVPEALQGDGWIEHYRLDLLPYWTMGAALGTPEGNYPTFRAMNGLVAGSSRRRPRMIARQIFAYSAGYLMTGDEALLGHAAAGVAWLREHAIDREAGGCFPELESDGRPVAGVRTAQDLAYCMLGLGAWFFVTRDGAAEADMLAGQALLFDPDAFWNADAGLVRDALDATMTNEVDVENDGGAELVAQLDPINAFMLLNAPVLTAAADRERFLADMRTLGETIVLRFPQGLLVWGVSNKLGQYGSKHADFGHSMKSIWMLLQLDKLLPDHPFHDFVVERADALVARAFDPTFGRWGNRPTSDTGTQWGSDWWIYAEADQLAATLNLTDARHDALLAQTQAHWKSDFVDRARVGEVVPSIQRDGSFGWSWSNGDTAKCNEWKNGYHSTEHALVLSILGHQREGKEVVLHFAVDPADVATFVARPYIFLGREVARVPGAEIEVGGRTLREVEVHFRDIY